MRIVIDGRLILPAMTGIGRYLLNLIPALAELAVGEQIEVWLQKDLPAAHPAWKLALPGPAQTARIQLRSLPYRHMSPAGMALLPLDIQRAHPDLLHYPHFDLPPLVPGRVVSTLHDLKYLARPGLFVGLGKTRRLIIRLLARHTARRSQRLIAVSQYTASDAVRLLDADPRKLRVIPHGVEPRFYQPGVPGEIDALRARYGLADAYILFVGERRPHKNLPGLIQAFAHFQRLTPIAYQLVIAGKRYGDYQAPEKLVEHLGLASQVRFIEALPDQDLPALLRGAAACALLSLYEGFGLPLLEAMASGTPVVASNLASLPEVAGAAALLVPPDDPLQAAEALKQAVEAGSPREQLIQRGRRRAREFTWQRCAEQTYRVYREAAR